MAAKASPAELFEKLAAFADIADRRGLVPQDDEKVASWLIHSGTRTLTATITVGDCRRAREFLRKIDAAKARSAAETKKAPAEPQKRKAAFAD